MLLAAEIRALNEPTSNSQQHRVDSFLVLHRLEIRIRLTQPYQWALALADPGSRVPWVSRLKMAHPRRNPRVARD
jgi:hypothetical protein